MLYFFKLHLTYQKYIHVFLEKIRKGYDDNGTLKITKMDRLKITNYGEFINDY